MRYVAFRNLRHFNLTTDSPFSDEPTQSKKHSSTEATLSLNEQITIYRISEILVDPATHDSRPPRCSSLLIV